MAAHEMGARLSQKGLQIPNDTPFDAADVSNNCAAFKCGKHLLHQRSHLGDGGTQDNQFRTRDRAPQVRGSEADGSHLLALPHADLAADETHDRPGQPAFPQGQAQRPAEQADANQCDFLPIHGASFRCCGPGFKLQVADKARSANTKRWVAVAEVNLL